MTSWIETLNEYLNENNGTITAFATVVLTAITFWYAFLTRKILKSTNKPEILIFLYPDEKYPLINLCIQNIGTGFASEITFSGDLTFTPATLHHTKPLKEIGIFKNGIDYLGPEKKLEIPLFFTYSTEGLPDQPINIVATYEDSVKTKHTESFSLKFKQWEDYRHFERDALDQIADKLADIERALRSNF